MITYNYTIKPLDIVGYITIVGANTTHAMSNPLLKIATSPIMISLLMVHSWRLIILLVYKP